MVNNKDSQHFISGGGQRKKIKLVKTGPIMLWQLFDPQPSRVWQQGQTRLGQNFVRCSSMRIFNVFRPQTGAISAFLTTLRLEMMMIEICMVTITLQLCVIINMKTKYCFLIFEQICPLYSPTTQFMKVPTCPQYGVFRYGGYTASVEHGWNPCTG